MQRSAGAARGTFCGSWFHRCEREPGGLAGARLLDLATQQLAGTTLIPTLEVDAYLRLHAIDRHDVEDLLSARAAGRPVDEGDQGLQIVDGLDRLRPFGAGNPKPIFASCGLTIKSRQRLGTDGRHLMLSLFDGRQAWEAIAFGLGGRMAELPPCVDVAYWLAVDHWKGQHRLQLNVQDIRPARSEG